MQNTASRHASMVRPSFEAKLAPFRQRQSTLASDIWPEGSKSTADAFRKQGHGRRRTPVKDDRSPPEIIPGEDRKDGEYLCHCWSRSENLGQHPDHRAIETEAHDGNSEEPE